MTDNNVIPTSMLTFIETEHGRLRRKQRGIDKKDLQSAMKYGLRRAGYPTATGAATSKYTYNNITYIVNDKTGEEITSYAKPLSLDRVPVSEEMIREHVKARVRVRKDLNCWTSNSVIVVDTSGSMKTCDVWGTRNRLGAVWVSVALDYIAHRLETGEGTSTDVVSILTLSHEPHIVLEEVPCTWILYNVIVDVYNGNHIPPRDHGPFLPSIRKAKELLSRNTRCPANLIFWSDGAPSDKVPIGGPEALQKNISDQVGDLASIFGRRLTFTAIGIGDKEHFSTLQNMVDSAKDFEAKAELKLPSLSSESIGTALTASATSLMETKTELFNGKNSTMKQVREVRRESKQKASEKISCVSDDEFWIYHVSKVRRRVYKEWHEEKVFKKAYEDVSLQHPEAMYVAFSKRPFGEGAERFAYRFFEVAEDGITIVGKALVAKESRYLVDDDGKVGDNKDRKKFAKTFCSTQQRAKRLAEKFNNKMDRLQRIDARTPRVYFLDCSIYELKDDLLGNLTVLVEDKLDQGEWKKWNNNDGNVDGMVLADMPPKDYRHLANDLSPDYELGMLNEESDEDESDDEERGRVIEPKVFDAGEVAQAFSHFTYHMTGRRRLVCDLQGVYDSALNILMLSDPVIHYHDPGNIDRRCVHGRTDRGRKGILDFFHTHKPFHGHLCSMMIKGFRPNHHHHQHHHHHHHHHRNHNHNHSQPHTAR